MNQKWSVILTAIIGIALIVNASILSMNNALAQLPKLLNSAALVGDIGCSKSGKATIAAITKEKPVPSEVVLLGDLSYKSSTDCVPGYITQLKAAGVKDVKCVIGNHDAAEEESVKLERAYFKLCGDGDGFFTVDMYNLTLIGLNTQRSLSTSTNFLKTLDNDTNPFVVTLSHKSLCEVVKSKHGAVKCDAAFKNQLARLDVDADIGAHNHCMAADMKGNYVSGAGGRSHYACSGWAFVNDKTFGYMLIQIFGDHLGIQFKDQKNKALSDNILVYN